MRASTNGCIGTLYQSDYSANLVLQGRHSDITKAYHYLRVPKVSVSLMSIFDFLTQRFKLDFFGRECRAKILLYQRIIHGAIDLSKIYGK